MTASDVFQPLENQVLKFPGIGNPAGMGHTMVDERNV
jgi:hypothetical protein